MSNYETHRKTLWNAAAALDAEAQGIESGYQYHHDQLAAGAAKVERLRRESAAIKDAAGTLGGLDKAGMIIKIPVDQPAPGAKAMGSGDAD